ncbi:hypothetical protein BHM03_00038572 [Ensete ventricosum]|nr:hypothetical protein BHM03_00038572 [Ensete ventricosum]
MLFIYYPAEIDLEVQETRKSLMSEPTLPIYLKFTEVRYSVVLKGITTTTEKHILHGITGSVRPGELLALMGPSGIWKIAIRLKSIFRMGFVTQDDVLFAHLTVRETLTYAALLRLPRTMTREQKKDRAMDAIYELGLER